MTDQPNFLLIHCESMDGRAMDWAGHPAASTPNLDRLAQRGTGFVQSYCNSPQCVPSRASFMSGHHVHEIEAWNNTRGLEPTDTTLLDDAARAGYETHEIGRRDYTSGAHWITGGITAWLRTADLGLPQKEPPVTEIADHDVWPRPKDRDSVDQAVDRLQAIARDGDTPFLLNLGVTMAHPGPGYRTTPDHLECIPEEKVTIPPDDPLEHPVMRKMSIAKNTDEPVPTETIRTMRRRYLGMISETDAMVGQVLDALEELDLREDTVVVFFSDHGDMQMEHRQYLKNALYEGSARVPLIVAGPGVEEDQHVKTPVSLVSLRQTLADLGGYDPIESVSGPSLAPALSGGKPPSEPILCQYHSNTQCTGSFMLRDSDWKYIAYVGYEPQLFDLSDDPDEMQNLAPARPDVVERMDEMLESMCNYRCVDRRAKADDRACFRAWREGVEDEQYRETLRSNFHGFSDTHEEQIEKWLAGELETP